MFDGIFVFGTIQVYIPCEKLSTWFRMVLIQIVTRIYKDTLTLRYPSNIMYFIDVTIWVSTCQLWYHYQYWLLIPCIYFCILVQHWFGPWDKPNMTLSDMGPQNNMWCKTKHDVFFFLVISSECFPNDPFVWSRLAGGGGWARFWMWTLVLI